MRSGRDFADSVCTDAHSSDQSARIRAPGCCAMASFAAKSTRASFFSAQAISLPPFATAIAMRFANLRGFMTVVMYCCK